MIDFLDELGNFKQKNFYISKCNFFYILQQRTHDKEENDFFVQILFEFFLLKIA